MYIPVFHSIKASSQCLDCFPHVNCIGNVTELSSDLPFLDFNMEHAPDGRRMKDMKRIKGKKLFPPKN